MMPADENSHGENDNEMKTATMVKEQQARALKGDLANMEKAIDEERRKNEELLSNLRYLQADFENYRKRVDREIRELEDFSTVGLLKKLIPVMDDLDLAVTTAMKAEDKGLLEGVKMVQKNLATALESEGLESIKSVGKPFDPSVHEAVDMVQGKGVPEDTVVEEMRKGYSFKGKVLRPSSVKVEMASRQDAKEEGGR